MRESWQREKVGRRQKAELNRRQDAKETFDANVATQARHEMDAPYETFDANFAN